MGPYKADGDVWSPCEVDHCNGLYINDEYVYVTTIFYPYTVACFSRGTWAEFYPKCTKNPRSCSGNSSAKSLIDFSILTVLPIIWIFTFLFQWEGIYLSLKAIIYINR